MAYDMSEIDGEHFTEPCMVVDVKDIQKLSPVTPQPKTGHWINTHGLGAKYYQCSICGDFDVFPQGKYCKWCGTKMVESQESEDKE